MVDKKQSEQIPFFAYYLLENQNYDYFNPKNIHDCFAILNIPPYSNIAAYLNKKSKKERKKKRKFIKNKNGYTLAASALHEIQDIIDAPVDHIPTEELLTLEIFNGTRGYLTNNAKEAALCYDFGQYNACLIMIRKLIETLIIELFEKKGIKSKIKDANNDYFQLSYLIDAFLGEDSWTVSRNTKKSIPDIKKYADLAAHNRRFSAKKKDVDKIRADLRIVVQELLSLIDY
jgi:hypothetical protein